jgi:hypothetical protein
MMLHLSPQRAAHQAKLAAREPKTLCGCAEVAETGVIIWALRNQ